MDYFNWNFAFGFVYITVIIVISTVLKPAKPRIASLPLSLLLLQVCSQLLLTPVLMAMRVRYPFRFSSMPKGEVARPGVYSIIEDVVAVDGGQGTRFREILNQRYLASAPIRRLLKETDLLWGISGVAVAVALVVLIFELHNADISWVIGKCAFPGFVLSLLYGDLDPNLDATQDGLFHGFGLRSVRSSQLLGPKQLWGRSVRRWVTRVRTSFLRASLEGRVGESVIWRLLESRALGV